MAKHFGTVFFWGVLSLASSSGVWAGVSAYSGSNGSVVVQIPVLPPPKKPKETAIVGSCSYYLINSLGSDKCAYLDGDEWVVVGGPYSCPVEYANLSMASDGTVYCNPVSWCEPGFGLSAGGVDMWSISYPPSPKIYYCRGIPTYCPPAYSRYGDICERTIPVPKQPGGNGGPGLGSGGPGSGDPSSGGPGSGGPGSGGPGSGGPGSGGPGSGGPGSGGPGSGAPGSAGPGGNPLGGNCVGNPINPGTGNKYQNETDYSGRGATGTLSFTRHYHSDPFGTSDTLGSSWRSGFDRSVSFAINSTSQVFVSRPDGALLRFVLQAGAWKPDADVPDRLAASTDSAGAISGWQYTTAWDETERYDAAGRLVSITSRSGMTQTLAYDTKRRLLGVTDGFGRSLGFTYDTDNRVITMTDPGGRVYAYTYDANGNLASVTYPGGAVRRYHYENATFKDALTGITDEKGNRHATWGYDAQGRAVSSEHAGGAGRVILAYQADGSAAVTDAIGTARIYRFAKILGVPRNIGASQPGGAGCAAAAAAQTFDANGNVATRTDFNGAVSAYQYDLGRNLEVRRIEAQGSPEQRTISTEWHPAFRLVSRTAAPRRITTYTYDTQGNLVSLSEQATSDPDGGQGFNAAPVGASRSWTYVYTTYGRMARATDPLGNSTTYAYYPDDDPDPGRRGNLRTATNALGQTARIDAYDPNGLPLTLTEANGVVIQLAYDTLGRLTSRSTGGETTAYAYDPAGLLTRITQPDGATLNYAYDAAHRLTEIADSLGNRIVYTLDPLGNRIGEDIFDPAGRLLKSISRAYDALGRLQSLTGVATE